MKTIYVSGTVMLAATVFSLLCAAGIFFDILGAHQITSQHLALTTLFFSLPPFLWRRSIGINYRSLILHSGFGAHDILVDQIKRVRVTAAGHHYVLAVDKTFGSNPTATFDLGLFNKHDIKDLLRQLQAQNANIQVDAPADLQTISSSQLRRNRI